MVLEEFPSGGVATCDVVAEISSLGVETATKAASAPRRRHAKKDSDVGRGKGNVVLDNRSIDLLFFEDAPKVLQFNRYVRSGYRARYSYWDCVKSIFRIHNETGNIWMHLLPLVVWFTLVATGIMKPWDSATGLYYVVNFTVFGCLTGSVCYHTFMGCDCHYHKWLTLDVFGVYVVILATQFATIRSGFACYPNARLLSEVAYYTLGLLGIASAAMAKSAKQRGLPLLALWLLRMVFVASRWVLSGANMQSGKLYLLGEVLAVVGGVINVARFPEKFFQHGQARKAAPLDNWFNSHQLMHIFSFCTMVSYFLGLKLDMEYYRNPAALCLA